MKLPRFRVTPLTGGEMPFGVTDTNDKEYGGVVVRTYTEYFASKLCDLLNFEYDPDIRIEINAPETPVDIDTDIAISIIKLTEVRQILGDLNSMQSKPEMKESRMIHRAFSLVQTICRELKGHKGVS